MAKNNRNKDSKIVVILEDNPDEELESLENILTAEGIDVLSFKDPQVFLDCLKEGMEYDIVLLDLTYMNNEKYDGQDILKKLKKKHPKKPVIFRSAYSNKRDIHLNKNADGMILKRKYHPGQVLDIIEGYIDKYRRNR